MIEYTIKVYANGDKHWYVAGKRHREDGPAIEDADGYKYWYVDGKKFTEAEFDKRRNPVSESCEGRVVEIDGKQYRLAAI